MRTKLNHDILFHVVAKAGEADGRRYLEGIASTTDTDLQHERMTANALATMAKDATGLPLTTSHSNELIDQIGEIVEAKLLDGKLFIKAELDEEDPQAVKVWKAIKKGREVGFSVGGKITASRDSAQKGVKRIIDGVTLNHVMLTTNPANPATFGTAIAKSLSELDAQEDEQVTSTTQGTHMENLDKTGAKFSAETLGSLKDIHDSGDDAVKAKVRGMLGDSADEVLGKADADPADATGGVAAKTDETETVVALAKTDMEAAIAGLRTEFSEAITAAFTELVKAAPQLLKGSPNASLAKSGEIDSDSEGAFAKALAKAIR